MMPCFVCIENSIGNVRMIFAFASIPLVDQQMNTSMKWPIAKQKFSLVPNGSQNTIFPLNNGHSGGDFFSQVENSMDIITIEDNLRFNMPRHAKVDKKEAGSSPRRHSYKNIELFYQQRNSKKIEVESKTIIFDQFY